MKGQKKPGVETPGQSKPTARKVQE